jgi:lantibiotic modifying enzyme
VRVLGELFGSSAGRAGAVYENNEHELRIAALVDGAQLAFHNAYRTASATCEPPLFEQWMRQESHAGQQRPVVTNLNGEPVIFKPRSLSADVAWAGVIDWFSGCLGEQISSEFNVVDLGEAGWMSIVEHRECADVQAVSRYYMRLGVLASLAWALGSSDATASNIVSAGPLPTWIDAETSLVPGNDLFALDPATEFRRCGIAPFAAPDAQGRNISFGAAVLRGRACVHRRTVAAEGRCIKCHSLPWTPDSVHYIQEFEENLCAGFRQGLRVLQGSKKALFAISSPLSAFEYARGRIVARPSAAYALVREWMFSRKNEEGVFPDVPGLLSRLPAKFDLGPAGMTLLTTAEFAALSLGDLPRFEAEMSERFLMIDGGIAVEFSYSAFGRARGRLTNLTRSRVEWTSLAWERYVASMILAHSAGA